MIVLSSFLEVRAVSNLINSERLSVILILLAAELRFWLMSFA